MSSLSQSIMLAAHALPEGGLVSPKEFLHLGARAAVDQTLARLAKEGQLMRIGRGAYTVPMQGRFGERPPSAKSVLEALAASSGDFMVPTGAAEANALGLTTQVPTREIFLTSGPSRTLLLGNQKIELRHGSRWLLAMGRRPAGMAIRALSWLGPERTPQALTVLRSKLPPLEWEALYSSRALLPSWMARAVSEVALG
jgi:hypothetical protein